jgi:hypothetical protein
MKKLLALPLLAAIPAVLAAPPEMQPGLWEITSRMEMPGMPKMPPQVYRHCYTKKDLEDAKRTVPQGGDRNCEVKDYRLQGSTATWKMECRGEAAMTGTGTMTFGAQSYTGSMKSRMRREGTTIETTQSWSAKRIGDCRP